MREERVLQGLGVAENVLVLLGIMIMMGIALVLLGSHYWKITTDSSLCWFLEDSFWPKAKSEVSFCSLQFCIVPSYQAQLDCTRDLLLQEGLCLLEAICIFDRTLRLTVKSP